MNNMWKEDVRLRCKIWGQSALFLGTRGRPDPWVSQGLALDPPPREIIPNDIYTPCRHEIMRCRNSWRKIKLLKIHVNLS